MRVQIVCAFLAAAFAARSHAGDCPQGADYLATLDGLRGACGVAWNGAQLAVCVPEAFAAGAAGAAPQLRTAACDADGVWGDPAEMTAGAALGPRLRMVADIAVAANGDIAVADAAGVVFVRQAAGDGGWTAFGEGVLERPSGVSWIGGRIAVSDARLRAVVVLSADGREMARLGAGALAEPAGLAPLRDGSLVVADRLADCLWRFDALADGAFAATPVRLGESGSNPGQFSAPRDVCVVDRGGADCLLVADELNHRVQVVRPDGAFVGFFGMHALLPRQGEGRIHYPVSLAVAPDGVTLAVAEAFEDRVQVLRLKPEADPVDPSAFGGEFISSHFGSEIGCGADTLAVVDREIEALAICDARTTPPIHMCVVGGGGALPMRFGEVSAIAVVPEGSSAGAADIWVADRVHRRIDVLRLDWDRSKPPVFEQFLPRLAKSFDLAALARRLPPSSDGAALRTPEVVDIEFARGSDPAREVVLLDRANMSIVWTDARASAGAVERLPREAVEPEEIAVSDGVIAVADPGARSVFLRTADGAWSRLADLGGIGFGRPSGVAFRASAAGGPGTLVVSDAARDAVLVAESDGSARVVGERGTLDEQFWDPQGIAHSPLGLIVIDRGNHRYERFGEGFAWNLTGTLGRYYDRKRRGSPGGPPPLPPSSTPATRGGAS